MRFIIVIACLLHVTYAAPQFLTFKDGKIGVNFFGYHAEAGLGGALGQGGPLGGLSASAGTPWGQHAEAGLGGTVQGRAAGGLYAGAQAIPGVAAGTFLAGDTSQGGVAGSESHAFGVGSSSKHTLGVASQNLQQPPALLPSPSASLTPPAIENTNVIQKVHSPKKYSSQKTSDAAVNVEVSSKSQPVVQVTRVEEIVTPAVAPKVSVATVDAPIKEAATVMTRIQADAVDQQQTAKTLAGTTAVAGDAGQQHVEPALVVNKYLYKQRVGPALPLRLRHKLNGKQVVRTKSVYQTVEEPQVAPHTIFINNPTPSTVFTPVAPTYASHTITRNTDINIQPNIIQNALQIPIGILQSLQDSLSGFRLHATKSTQIHTG